MGVVVAGLFFRFSLGVLSGADVDARLRLHMIYTSNDCTHLQHAQHVAASAGPVPSVALLFYYRAPDSNARSGHKTERILLVGERPGDRDNRPQSPNGQRCEAFFERRMDP